MLISCAVATFNEEKNIKRSLSSVYDWVDEIVVVDGSSTDKTVEVMKKFERLKRASSQKNKIRILIEDNPPMFHQNKQKAIERCRGKWILQLDADEEVTEELKNEIVTLLHGYIAKKAKKRDNNSTMKQFNNEKVAYWIPRINFFLSKPLKKGGQYPDYTIRLYKNGVARFPGESVHEQVSVDPTVILSDPDVVSGESKNPIKSENYIGYLHSPLLHYPYPTFEEYLNKWNRYTTLDARLLKKQGVKPSFFNFLKYFCLLPKYWFFKSYFRHLGFLDGFPGFIFSLFSSLRYPTTYIKLVEASQK